MFLENKPRVTANKCQKEKIITLKEAIQKDGQRHLYVYVYSFVCENVEF